jgi:N-acetylglutamate synthase-like GNAT family acetyltransferase
MRYEGLKDGTVVLLREPKMDDVEGSLKFFRNLPPEDRRYLRTDVTRRDVIERRIRQATEGRVHRVIALVHDQIVADGALERSDETWRRHMGEIRVVVAREFQHRGLGKLIIADLHSTAQQQGVEKVVAKMAAPQAGARKIFEKLGFHMDSVLPDYIKDANGKPQSLVVMSCSLDEMSMDMKDVYQIDDRPDG